jgi:hypothetical protein
VRSFVEAEADAQLAPEATSALQRAAACDAPLYADALLRSGVLAEPAAVAAVGVPTPGEEDLWLVEAQAWLIGTARC